MPDRFRRLVFLLTTILLSAAAPGRTVVAKSRNDVGAAPEAASSLACDGQGRTGWMLRQTVVGATNILGLFSETRVGWCRPLVRRKGLLWQLTQVKPELFLFLTPSFGRLGGSLEVAPLSFLVLRLGVSGVWYWPLPGFETAGYFGVPGYDFRWPSDGISHDVTVTEEHGGGVNLSGALVLRGAVTLSRLRHGPLKLVALDSFATEYWYLGRHAFYYSQQVDTVLARSDVVLLNDAFLLIELPLSRRVGLQLGVTDSLLYVPRNGRLGWHQVGGLVTLPMKQVSRLIAELTLFVRVTAFTEHNTRQLSFAWNFLAGMDISLRI